MPANTPNSDCDLPNTQNIYKVTPEDFPVHCPMPGSSLWNSHPRVYLPVEKTGQAKCIYCGAEYVLDTAPHHE
ncbi:MAG: zinc-finger domain-containing protein [Gammaproteobacteria bacterium]